MSELAGQVRAALAGQGPKGSAGQPYTMGLFSVPFRPKDGPLAGHVLRVYRSGRDPEVLEPLVRRHAAYLECLERTGLTVPRTELVLLHDYGVLRPVVVQSAVPKSFLLSHRMAAVDTASALQLLEHVSLAICRFWTGVAQRPERIGLNASLRNVAVGGDGSVMFLDTFPPLIGYSREEMGRILLRFSESGLTRGIGALLPGRIREIQDPWYALSGNIGLVLDGVMRLRPRDRETILGWAEGFAQAHLSPSDQAALLRSLTRPRPRLASGQVVRRLGTGLRPNA